MSGYAQVDVRIDNSTAVLIERLAVACGYDRDTVASVLLALYCLQNGISAHETEQNPET